MGLSVWYPVYRTKGEHPQHRKERPNMYEIKSIRGHVEVFLDGTFCFSADTWGEAEQEIALMTA